MVGSATRSNAYEGFTDDGPHFVCNMCRQRLKKAADRFTSTLLRHRRLHETRETADSAEPHPKQRKLAFSAVDGNIEFEDACLRFFAGYGIPFQPVESNEFSRRKFDRISFSTKRMKCYR
ncbi:hypothetical protein L596_030121 [Steinernema carpocapsae]|uniref:Uncharacterized protein n=1 Tax=Steinernema carpocapsae TaxID=34508 RepID=A0A4U5LRU1_STECR|nr:hypothetical protein L596_030121 [Steinernema carpocapsae]